MKMTFCSMFVSYVRGWKYEISLNNGVIMEAYTANRLEVTRPRGR